jgi:hypothetical protein
MSKRSVRAAFVRCGVNPAAGQTMNEPGVDRAKRDLTDLRPGPQRGVALEEPGDLAAREVGVEDEAGPLVEDGLVALGLEAGAHLGGLPALPDDRPVDRVARLPVPEDRRLALVGDADGAESPGGDSRGGDRLRRHAAGLLPDLLGVVLDPAGRGVVLGDLGVGAAEHLALGAEHERGGPGGALVEGENGGVGAGVHGRGL